MQPATAVYIVAVEGNVQLAVADVFVAGDTFQQLNQSVRQRHAARLYAHDGSFCEDVVLFGELVREAVERYGKLRSV